MKIEHIGLIVRAPIDMGAWYVEHLGFRIRLQNGDNSQGAAWLEDEAGTVLLELGATASTPPLNLESMPPLQLHMAVESDDPEEDSRRLRQAGATFVERCASAPGDSLLLLRDPWGMVIQLARRGPNSPIRRTGA